MFQAGTVVENVKSSLRHENNDALIYSILNQVVQDIASMTSWEGLRSSVQVDFSEKDSDNMMLLPSDMAGVDAVSDANKNWYSQVDAAYALADRHDFKGFSWFYGNPVSEPLVMLKGFSIIKDGDTPSFSGDASAVDLTDHIGEYIAIENVPGYFKVITGGKLFPTYRGSNLTNNYFQIRPSGTKRFSIVNEYGVFTESVVTVYHWKKPEAILSPMQIIRFPMSRPVELQVMIRVLREHDKKRTEPLQRAYAESMSQMMAMNSPFAFQGSPTGADGNPFRWY